MMRSWLLAARPKTLPAAIVPVWVGSVPSLYSIPDFSWLLFWCTLISCLCIQIATNLFNDAVDSEKGADTEHRLGPLRVTASGLLSQKQVMVGAVIFCTLAAFFSLPLVQERGWTIIAIGIVSLFFSYGYTGGPWPLAYKGLGELFVILFFGFVAVLGTHFVHTGELGSAELFSLALQTGLYSCVLIAINNLRDCDEDSHSGKHTLAVRLGKRFARFEITLLCLFPVAFFFWPIPDSAFLLAALAPLILIALVIIHGIWRTEPSRVYNKFLGLAALQLINFALIVTFYYAYQPRL